LIAICGCGLVSSQFPELSLVDVFTLLNLGYFNNTELRAIGTVSILAATFTLAPRHRLATSVVAAVAIFVLGRSELIILATVPLIILILTLWRWHPVIISTLSQITIALVPFVALTFGQALWVLGQLAVEPPAGTRRSTESSTRVLWVVFDEMDQRLAFECTDSGLYLPEHQRLRRESLSASNAYPPADMTLMSMPALITGRMISQARPVSPSELMITYEGSDHETPLSRESNLFSQALSAGFNSALIGWYHPYCRIIGSSVSECDCGGVGERSLPISILAQFRGVGQSLPFASGLIAPTEPELREKRRKHWAEYRQVLEGTKKAAANTSLGLVLAHFPIPHMPGIYDRRKGAFDDDGEWSYVDNLYLADKTLGELRQTMEEAGVWDKTILLVSSDHWWRANIWKAKGLSWQHVWTAEDDATFSGQVDRRVPFLLRLPGQSDAVAYESGFNTIVTHDLVLALLKGEVSTTSGVTTWLDQHGRSDWEPLEFKVAK
jgi:hypothetical protein